MEKDPVLEKYYNEGFGKNAFGWYFNPWIDEYDEDYDPHNDKEYNERLNKKETKWNPKLTPEQIEELIAEDIEPGDNEYDMYLWNHGIKPFEKNDDNNKGNDEGGINGENDGSDKGNDSDKKGKLTSIEIDPISDLKLTYKYVQDNEEKTDKSEKAVSYDETYIENTKKIMERHGFKIDNISEAIDPNIIALLINNPEKLNFSMEDYLEMLNGKKDSGVKIKYSLKDIYKSEIPLEEIKNIIKIAKEAKKLNKDSIQVEKNSFLKEKFESFKRFTKGLFRKKLPAEKKEEKIDLNEFATKNTVKNIKEKYFVPRVKVDEKPAVEKVNHSKGELSKPITPLEKSKAKQAIEQVQASSIPTSKGKKANEYENPQSRLKVLRENVHSVLMELADAETPEEELAAKAKFEEIKKQIEKVKKDGISHNSGASTTGTER